MSTQQRVKIRNEQVNGSIEYTVIAYLFPDRGGAVVHSDSNEVRRVKPSQFLLLLGSSTDAIDAVSAMRQQLKSRPSENMPASLHS